MATETTSKTKGPRRASTYRAARRNAARKAKKAWREIPLRLTAVTRRQRAWMRLPDSAP